MNMGKKEGKQIMGVKKQSLLNHDWGRIQEGQEIGDLKKEDPKGISLRERQKIYWVQDNCRLRVKRGVNKRDKRHTAEPTLMNPTSIGRRVGAFSKRKG